MSIYLSLSFKPNLLIGILCNVHLKVKRIANVHIILEDHCSFVSYISSIVFDIFDLAYAKACPMMISDAETLACVTKSL